MSISRAGTWWVRQSLVRVAKQPLVYSALKSLAALRTVDLDPALCEVLRGLHATQRTRRDMLDLSPAGPDDLVFGQTNSRPLLVHSVVARDFILVCARVGAPPAFPRPPPPARQLPRAGASRSRRRWDTWGTRFPDVHSGRLRARAGRPAGRGGPPGLPRVSWAAPTPSPRPSGPFRRTEMGGGWVTGRISG
jgi:hypothetical protein